MISLRQHTAFITGASSGIGQSCARTFASAGSRLILCARRKERLDAFAEELRGEFTAEVLTIELDVRDRAAVEAAVAGLPEQWRVIDILVKKA